jgi:hypothetical protein
VTTELKPNGVPGVQVVHWSPLLKLTSLLVGAMVTATFSLAVVGVIGGITMGQEVARHGEQILHLTQALAKLTEVVVRHHDEQRSEDRIEVERMRQRAKGSP